MSRSLLGLIVLASTVVMSAMPARAADYVYVRPQLHDLEIARGRRLGGRAIDPRSGHEDHRN